MVSREECIATINSFIKTGNANILFTLFEYLCDVMEVPHKIEAIEFVSINPHIIFQLYPGILEGLSRHFDICKIKDKDNKLITVY